MLEITVGTRIVGSDYEIQDGDIIHIKGLFEEEEQVEDIEPVSKNYNIEPVAERKKESLDTAFKEFVVTVNGDAISMKGKESYIFVDIFDYIDFDLHSPKGRKIVTKVNGLPVSNYMQELPEGAVVEIYWED